MDADERFEISQYVAEHVDWTLRDYAIIVSKENPFQLRFTKNERFRHTNQRNDLRFNRHLQTKTFISNRSPYDVNE